MLLLSRQGPKKRGLCSTLGQYGMPSFRQYYYYSCSERVLRGGWMAPLESDYFKIFQMFCKWLMVLVHTW